MGATPDSSTAASRVHHLMTRIGRKVRVMTVATRRSIPTMPLAALVLGTLVAWAAFVRLGMSSAGLVVFMVGWVVMMMAMMLPSAAPLVLGVREAWPRQARARLSARLGDRGPTGVRGRESIRSDDGSGGSGVDSARRRGRLSVHAAQERLPARMPKPAGLHRDGVGARSGSARDGARRLLRRVLLGTDGGARWRRGDERHMGCSDCRRGVCREGASRGENGPRAWRDLHCSLRWP